ncbi:Vacuolar membrane protein [Dissostichus eleginoides]|uniref:Vacuolar membrane protein n=1 Tax=Dissostichus eleginoides TaxID=100907 RepID=A0AAD9EUK0_DISEL|nr:Vacuolar membrane protein [Dissostichus eleginoides]
METFIMLLRVFNLCSSAGCLSAAAGLKVWVAEGRVGAGRFLQTSSSSSSSSSSSFREQLHLPTSSLTPSTWRLHLLRNWKILK